MLKYAVKLSPKGAVFIARFEGFAAKPYNDANGYATIGYGHLLHYSRVSKADLERFPHDLTKEQGLQYLRADAQIAAHAVSEYIHVKLKQNQMDGLISFTYNCGAGSLNGTTVQRCVNTLNWKALPSALRMWTHDGHGNELQGLVSRRLAESNLILRGIYA